MRVSNIFLDFAATAYVYLDMAARTFYLAEENIGLYERIMRACRKSGKSFSALIADWMRRYEEEEKNSEDAKP